MCPLAAKPVWLIPSDRTLIWFVTHAKYIRSGFCCAGKCAQFIMPNGDFEKNKAGDNEIRNFTKIKQYGSKGGGIVMDGLEGGALTGFPGYPFDADNLYFGTNPRGDVGFALVANSIIQPTTEYQSLYFDWYVDNPYPFFYQPDTMSILANSSNITILAGRVDLYDYNRLVPPGNISHLTELLFDELELDYGGPKKAFVANLLSTTDFASVPNLMAIGSGFPLKEFVGRSLLWVFRYSTTVSPIAFGIDNLSVVDCLDDFEEVDTSSMGGTSIVEGATKPQRKLLVKAQNRGTAYGPGTMRRKTKR